MIVGTPEFEKMFAEVDAYRKKLFGENGELLIVTLILALRESVMEAACDETCPAAIYGWERPECQHCPVSSDGGGELYHDTERDIDCWIQYYVEKARAELGIEPDPPK